MLSCRRRLGRVALWRSGARMSLRGLWRLERLLLWGELAGESFWAWGSGLLQNFNVSIKPAGKLESFLLCMYVVVRYIGVHHYICTCACACVFCSQKISYRPLHATPTLVYLSPPICIRRAKPAACSRELVAPSRNSNCLSRFMRTWRSIVTPADTGEIQNLYKCVWVRFVCVRRKRQHVFCTILFTRLARRIQAPTAARRVTFSALYTTNLAAIYNTHGCCVRAARHTHAWRRRWSVGQVEV